MVDLVQRIRERAHRIWEEEGCPEGRDKEHWWQACREVDAAHDLRGEGARVSVTGSGEGPVTAIAGQNVQEEPPYASVDPQTEHSG